MVALKIIFNSKGKVKVFNFSANFKSLFLSAALVIAPVPSLALTYQDVIGKTFLSDSGSGVGSFLTSVSVKVTGRNTVLVEFLEASIIWRMVDVSAIEDKSKPPFIKPLMINCKNMMYATSPESGKENAISVREFAAGNKYKWGDYSAQDLLGNVGDDTKKSLGIFFKTVCEYTDQ